MIKHATPRMEFEVLFYRNRPEAVRMFLGMTTEMQREVSTFVAKDGWTYLHQCARDGDMQFAHLFVESGALPTPKMFETAVFNGKEELATFLLRKVSPGEMHVSPKTIIELVLKGWNDLAVICISSFSFSGFLLSNGLSNVTETCRWVMASLLDQGVDKGTLFLLLDTYISRIDGADKNKSFASSFLVTLLESWYTSFCFLFGIQLQGDMGTSRAKTVRLASEERLETLCEMMAKLLFGYQIDVNFRETSTIGMVVPKDEKCTVFCHALFVYTKIATYSRRMEGVTEYSTPLAQIAHRLEKVSESVDNLFALVSTMAKMNPIMRMYPFSMSPMELAIGGRILNQEPCYEVAEIIVKEGLYSRYSPESHLKFVSNLQEIIEESSQESPQKSSTTNAKRILHLILSQGINWSSYEATGWDAYGSGMLYAIMGDRFTNAVAEHTRTVTLFDLLWAKNSF